MTFLFVDEGFLAGLNDAAVVTAKLPCTSRLAFGPNTTPAGRTPCSIAPVTQA